MLIFNINTVIFKVLVLLSCTLIFCSCSPKGKKLEEIGNKYLSDTSWVSDWVSSEWGEVRTRLDFQDEKKCKITYLFDGQRGETNEIMKYHIDGKRIQFFDANMKIAGEGEILINSDFKFIEWKNKGTTIKLEKIGK